MSIITPEHIFEPVICMEAKSIQEIIQPLLVRIDNLERSNEQLKERVRHLEALVQPEKSYQKLTISAANHLRDSRLSCRDSEISKRPGWNSKTKIEQSPVKSPEPAVHEKVKTKPPIPKIVKSPAKQQATEEPKHPSSQKKINGGTKLPADNYQHFHQPNNRMAPQSSPPQKRIQDHEIAQGREISAENFTNKFEKLVKQNHTIINSMKVGSDEGKQLTPGNLVTKVHSPRSQCHNSHTTSPNSRSFISENPDMDKPVGQGKSADCDRPKAEVK